MTFVMDDRGMTFIMDEVFDHGGAGMTFIMDEYLLHDEQKQRPTTVLHTTAPKN